MLQRLKNHAIYYAVRALVGLLSLLPVRWCVACGRAIGALAGQVAWRQRRVALVNLALAYPAWTRGEKENLLGEMARRLGASAAVAARLTRSLDPLALIEFPAAARAVLDEALAQGKGVVAISAHLGNWELLAACLARRGYPASTIARPSYDARFTRLLHELRERHGTRVLWRDSTELADQIVATLAEGRILGFFIDQRLRKVRGVEVIFFGRPALTPTGAAWAALRCGAPVVGLFARGAASGRQQIVARRIAVTETGDRDEDLLRNTAAFTRVIEEEIRAHPADWLWFHERFELDY